MTSWRSGRGLGSVKITPSCLRECYTHPLEGALIVKRNSIISMTVTLESAMELLAGEPGCIGNRRIRLKRVACLDAELLEQLEGKRLEILAERSSRSLYDKSRTDAVIVKYGISRASSFVLPVAGMRGRLQV